VSIGECIGVHTMVRQQREQPVTAITITPAGVPIGAQVFAVVGTSNVKTEAK
jgi:hypothetical protein